MNFDFAEIDTKTLSDSGKDMIVKHIGLDKPLLAKNGEPVAITLLGPDSDVYREQSRIQVKKRINRSTDLKSLSEIDLAEADRDGLDLVVACTIGWKNVFDTDGKPVKFTKEAALELYTKYPVIREQADAFIVDRVRFIKASSEA